MISLAKKLSATVPPSPNEKGITTSQFDNDDDDDVSRSKARRKHASDARCQEFDRILTAAPVPCSPLIASRRPELSLTTLTSMLHEDEGCPMASSDHSLSPDDPSAGSLRTPTLQPSPPSPLERLTVQDSTLMILGDVQSSSSPPLAPTSSDHPAAVKSASASKCGPPLELLSASTKQCPSSPIQHGLTSPRNKDAFASTARRSSSSDTW